MNFDDVLIGKNILQDISKIRNNEPFLSCKYIIFVGRNSAKANGSLNSVQKIFELNNSNSETIVVTENPLLASIEKTYEKLSTRNMEYKFIAIGGGSVIDFAKLVKKKLNKKVKWFFCIYTLPGSATIVTPFSIYDNQEFKVGEYDDKMKPDISYINLPLLAHINQERLNSSMLDIYCHSVESFLSLASTTNSRENALIAIKYLKKYKKTNNLMDLVIADLAAGLSEQVGLVLFPHAAGHYLTYKKKVPHSISSFIFIPEYLRIIQNELALPNEIIEMFDDLQMRRLEISLSEAETNDLFSLTQKHMAFCYENSPVRISKQGYKKIVKRSLNKFASET